MKARVVWNDYTILDGEVFVRLGLRIQNRKRKNIYVRGTEPYLFVPEDEEVPDAKYIERVESGYESIFDQNLKKVVTKTPKTAGKLTKAFSWTGEADIPYYRRTSIHDGLSGYIDLPEETDEGTLFDKDVYHIDDIETDLDTEGEQTIEPRIMLSDIEVEVAEDESFEETQAKNTQPINVICSYDTYEEKYSVFFYNKHDSLDEPSEIRSIVEDEVDFNVPSIDLNVAESEEEMLTEFLNYINEKKFDLFSGWNWVDFDHQYIIGRCKKLDGVDEDRLSPFGSVSNRSNLRMNTAGIPAFDMMESFCETISRGGWRSTSLDYVSNAELGVGKIDDVNINEDWENNAEKLIGYNIVDVLLTVELDLKNDIHGFFYEMGDISSIPIYDTSYEKRIVDGYVMTRRGKDEILPSTNEVEEIGNAGGYVENPINGRKKNVGVADLKSLYPSAMITWNISTETISDSPEGFDNYVKVPKVPEPKKVKGNIQERQIEWDWLYCSLDKEGILPRTLKTLFKKRNREKEKMYAAETEEERAKWDRKQGATKVIMNSFYGNASSPYWRMANQWLGDAVTSTARYTLWKGKQSIIDAGEEPIYGDTDSHFIQLTADTIDEQVEELKKISAKMDEGASEIAQDIGIEGEHPYLYGDLHGDEYTCMMWEPEKVYSVFMQLGKKKRYAGAVRWKEGTFHDPPKTSISGFEERRSDSMPITAELQEKVIEMVLRDKEFDEISDYIRGVIGDIDEDSSDVEKFALPMSLGQSLEEYGNLPRRRASEYSNTYLDYEFAEGDDPFVFKVNSTPSGLPSTDVVAVEWGDGVPDGFELDKESIIERGIKKPTETIFREVDLEFSEVRSGKKAQGLGVEDNDGGHPLA